MSYTNLFEIYAEYLMATVELNAVHDSLHIQRIALHFSQSNYI